MSVLGMIPAALVLLGMVAFTDTGMGRGVRRAACYLWRTIRRQDGQQNDAQADAQAGGPIIGPGGQVMVPAIVGQVVPPPGPRPSRWRSLLLFRRPPVPAPGVGHVNPQVSQQGTWQGTQQGTWQGTQQGTWQGTPAGAPTGPVGWPTGPAPTPAWGTPPVPAWGTPPTPMPGWYPTEAWTGAVPTAQPVPQPMPQPVSPVVPTQPMPAPMPYPVTQPVTAPVTQPAAGVYASGQGHGVRLDPAPQPVTPAPGVPAAPGAPAGTPMGIPPGGDPAITARRAVVAGMLPQLQATPHGEQGRVIAALAAGLGVDARTIYRDIEALTVGRVIS